MRPSILTPRILWAALLFSQAIYVALIAGGILEAPSAPPDPMMLPVLGVVALGTAVVSFVLPRILHRNAVAQAMPTIQHQGMGPDDGRQQEQKKQEGLPQQGRAVSGSRGGVEHGCLRLYLCPHSNHRRPRAEE